MDSYPTGIWLGVWKIQGKENFLRRFIPNYAELTKGFTKLLKQYIPFFWDEIADRSFDALKHALTHAPLLHPPNYNQAYFLYLPASFHHWDGFSIGRWIQQWTCDLLS